jgi:hypothetical protein
LALTVGGIVGMQARLDRSVAAPSTCAVVTLQYFFVRESSFSRTGLDGGGGDDFSTIDGAQFAASMSSSEAGKTFFLFAVAAALRSPASNDLSRVVSWESITRNPFTIGTNFCSGVESCVGETWETDVGLADEWE